MNRRRQFVRRARHDLGGILLTLALVFGMGGHWACKFQDGTEDDDSEVGGRKNRPEPTGGESNGEGGAASGASDSGGSANEGGTGNEGGVPSEGGDGNEAGEGATGGTGSGVRDAASGSWTYLVYMLADNDLEPFAMQDLEEMMKVGSGGNVTVLVQVDRAVGEAVGSIGGIPEFTDTKRVRVEAGRLEELTDLGEIDMGSGAALTDFLNWGIRTAPAEHYAVVFWDHGASWPQFGADFSHRNNGLSLPELTESLDRAIQTSELLGPIDVVGFDACLMGSWEIAAGLSGRARYLVASEELEPGHGWDHERAIRPLRAGATPEAFGRAVLAGYQVQAEARGTFPRVTLSLTDVAKVGAVTRALEALTLALGKPTFAEHAPFVGRSRAESPTFGVSPGAESSEMTDLLMFVDALAAADPVVSAEVGAVKSALANAVVAQVRGPAYSDVGGLSIYFPERQHAYLESYDALADIGGWRSYLAEFYGVAQSIDESDGPVFINPGKVADVEVTQGGYAFSGQLATGSFDNLSETLFDFGYVFDTGEAVFLGQQPADVTARGLVSSEWDVTALKFTEGDKEEFGYYLLEYASEDLLSLTIPFVVNEDGGQNVLILVLVFDVDGNVVTQTFYSEIDGAWAEHEPGPDATLQVYVPTLELGADEISWQTTRTEFGADLELQFATIPQGAGYSVFGRLLAYDFAGNFDAVEAGL